MSDYTINEDAARRAKEANSFREYKPGSATAKYRGMVEAAHELGEQQKQRIDPMHHDKVDYLVDLYARKLAANLNERNIIDTRVPSVMIAGPSNFPTRKKEQQNAARDKNMGEYVEIDEILNKIRSTGMGGISADDKFAVEKLEAKLEDLKDSQERMKSANAYFRKHKTLDGCPHLSEEVIAQVKDTMSRHWRTNSVPFPAYQLSNNNQNIKSTQQRIDELKSRSDFVGWEFAGGKAEINEAQNRLQIFFDDKPGEAERAELKRHGFKWAPSQGAWQRQLTRNAIRSAGYVDCIKPLDGKTPIQHQPFMQKSAVKDER